MLTASEITRLLDVANAGVQRGEVALARKVYQGILAGHPDHVPTLVSLAMSHIAVGQYEEADGILGKVLEPHSLVFLVVNITANGASVAGHVDRIDSDDYNSLDGRVGEMPGL